MLSRSWAHGPVGSEVKISEKERCLSKILRDQ